MTEDLHIFLRDFGKPVTLHLSTGDCGILGIYDDPFLNQMLGEIDMDTRSKRVLCIESEVAAVKREGFLTIIDQRYSVVRKVPDGTGMVVLYLSTEDGEE